MLVPSTKIAIEKTGCDEGGRLGLAGLGWDPGLRAGAAWTPG